MSASQKFPPSERDFKVYEYVELGGATTRQAASWFDLSQTRVCQIVERVAEWQAEVVPRRAEQFVEKDLLALGKNMAGQRLHSLYGEALDAWRRSQGESITLKRNAGDAISSTTTKTGFGQASFLHVAIRATVQMATMAVLPGLIEGLQAAAIEGAKSDQSEPSGVEVETVEVSDAQPEREPRDEQPGASEQEPAPGRSGASKPSPSRDCSASCADEQKPPLENPAAANATQWQSATSLNDANLDPLEAAPANGPVQPADDVPTACPDLGAATCGEPAAAHGAAPANCAASSPGSPKEVVINLDADPSELPPLRVRQVGADEEGMPIMVVELASGEPATIRFEQAEPEPPEKEAPAGSSRGSRRKKGKEGKAKARSRVSKQSFVKRSDPRSA